MDAFISSLPDKEWAILYIYYKDADQYGMEPDGNVCTKANVVSATAKGWEVYYYNNGKWQPYEGAETVSAAGVEEYQADATLYDLGGRNLLGKPRQKGIYVKEGRKIVYR